MNDIDLQNKNKHIRKISIKERKNLKNFADVTNVIVKILNLFLPMCY
jgi:hypothetical protein